MTSIVNIKKLLSVGLVNRLQANYGQFAFENILKGFAAERCPVIRINTLKTSVQNMMISLREMSVRFERIKFLPDSLIITNQKEKFFEKLPMYEKGEIYFQGISSQLPVLFLDPRPGEKVSDMCAAPGSKTAQMAIRMGNIGEIVANEKDQIRFEKLKYNLEKQGVKIVKCLLGDGGELGEKYPQYFDKVLLDAPCSAEGRIDTNEPRTYKFWSEKVVGQNAKLQRRLFRTAVRVLKPGGVLVYSTCTLAPQENELLVKGELEEFQGVLNLEKIDLDFKYKLPFFEGLNGTIKAMPSNISEGFFVAKFRKV
ncbi:RsmB/NOP family class I SAM-dependent RNA methyltransferase [Candidatus Peregrinibacteria bacterium]|nr:RsmB/NOP family class I SAM-dependent RNA methyltransferase [Candidatus Peregrinibacteria bacterium]